MRAFSIWSARAEASELALEPEGRRYVPCLTRDLITDSDLAVTALTAGWRLLGRSEMSAATGGRMTDDFLEWPPPPSMVDFLRLASGSTTCAEDFLLPREGVAVVVGTAGLADFLTCMLRLVPLIE